MSFLEKEDSKQSAFWDWVVGIGLIVLIGGFTFYYHFQKRSSISRFRQADSLFIARDFPEAGQAYEELKNAQYLTTQHDSTIYARLDTIETAKELALAQVAQVKSRLAAGDTTGVLRDIETIRHRDLLPPEEKAWLDSLRPGPDGSASKQ
jgi:hypothetical protein